MRIARAAAALAVLAALSAPAEARTVAQADLDQNGFKLYGLPLTPASASAAVPLQFVTPAAGHLSSTGLNGSVTASATIPYADIAGAPAAITATTGDVVSAGPGSVPATIQANVVSSAKFRQGLATSLVGNPTGSTANVQDITCGVDGQVYGRFSGAIACAAVPVGSLSGAYSASLGLGPTALGSAGVATSFGRSDQVHAAYRSDMPLAANWYVDPVNGSNAAACTSAATACATVGEIKRRWWGAEVTSDTTVNALGDVPASDTHTWNTRIALGAHVFFTGSLGATTGFGGAAIDNTLFTGAVTTYTAGSATPAVDDVELCDTSIPTSFTASGLMGAGVIFRRTVTSTRHWYAVKDLGGKCIRITVPMNNVGPATFASNPLTVGNAYSAFHMWTMPPQTFGFADASNVKFDTLRMIDASAFEDGGPRGYGPIRSRVWIDTRVSPFITLGAGCTNCLISLGSTGGIVSFGTQTPPTIIGGGFIGTGSAHYTFFGQGGVGGAMVFQGAGITINDWGYFTIEAGVAFYDLSISAITTVGNGRAAFMQNGMWGKGNSGKLVQLNWGGTLYYGQSATLPPFVAGSTSDASPIQIGSTSYAVSALPAVVDTLLSPVTNFTSTVYETGGPTMLTWGAVVNGALVKRSGAALIGAVAGTDYQAAGSYITSLTTDIVAGGPGAAPATIQPNVVDNTKLADMPTARFKGRTTAGTGDPEDLTATQATAMLNVFDATHQGLVPASGGGTTNFVRADGTWAVPAGSGGTITSVGGTSGRISSTGTTAIILDLVATAVTPGSYTYPNLTVDTYGRLTSASNGATPEVPLTFINGARRTGNNVAVDLTTGIAGGQSVVGGTAASNDLTLSSTTSGTKGRILVGGIGTSFNEATGAIVVGPGTTGVTERIMNPDSAANYGQVFFYPNTGTNVGSAVSVIPRGTGVSGNVSALNVFATDYPADTTNYEFSALRATGSTFVVGTGKAGTGTNRPLMLAAGWLTNGTTNANQVLLNTNGTVTMSSLGNGLTRTDAAGLLSTEVMPTSNRVLAGNAGGTDFVASDEIRLDWASTGSLMASQDGAVIWRDLTGNSMVGAGTYSQVRSFWNAHVYTLQSEAAGGGLVRDMLINADTGNLEADGDFVNVNAAADLTLKGAGNVNLFTVSGQPSLSVIGSGVGQARVYVTPSNTVASATNAVLDAFQVGDETITITGAVPITTSTGFNPSSFKAPKFSTAATISSTATVAIYGAPSIVSGGGTLTEKFGLWVQDSTARFDGPTGGGAVFEFLNDSTGNTSAAAGRVQVFVPGVGTRYLRLYTN